MSVAPSAPATEGAQKSSSLANLSLSHDTSLSPWALPAQTYIRSNHHPWDGIGTGALVFDHENRILLVQRSPWDSSPNLWEVPGGAVDPEDPTILHGCARELWEEAGLQATHFHRLVTEGGESSELGHVFMNSTKTKLIGKFMFEVEVQGHEVQLDDKEHQDYVWATEEEVKDGKVGDGEITLTKGATRDVILEGFRLRSGR